MDNTLIAESSLSRHFRKPAEESDLATLQSQACIHNLQPTSAPCLFAQCGTKVIFVLEDECGKPCQGSYLHRTTGKWHWLRFNICCQGHNEWDISKVSVSEPASISTETFTVRFAF